jgi:hypothetical protein
MDGWMDRHDVIYDLAGGIDSPLAEIAGFTFPRFF